MFGVNVNLNTG